MARIWSSFYLEIQRCQFVNESPYLAAVTQIIVGGFSDLGNCSFLPLIPQIISRAQNAVLIIVLIQVWEIKQNENYSCNMLLKILKKRIDRKGKTQHY